MKAKVERFRQKCEDLLGPYGGAAVGLLIMQIFFAFLYWKKTLILGKLSLIIFIPIYGLMLLSSLRKKIR